MVGDACRKRGKTLGVGGINDDEDARRYIGMGSRFINSANDHSFIVEDRSSELTSIANWPRRPGMGQTKGRKKKRRAALRAVTGR
jgi:hypothetical protein